MLELNLIILIAKDRADMSSELFVIIISIYVTPLSRELAKIRSITTYNSCNN